ncbi:KpsF/GutQ family sugar-phosphate isomerase [Demequina sediminicola]|uniref:KpsF/GutQ family sugar-phosphate isomerase n=1 Tax=Demequina sediminicola TaxID=1095026 RepID=UPI0007802CDF|nr:SIS domain-containing protein [Demequina sediminicola]
MKVDSTSERDEAQRFIRSEAEAVAYVADQVGDDFFALVDQIMATPGKVIVSGAGTSGTIARRLAHLLNVSGTPAFYQNPSDALHGSLAVANENDLLIALSKGGDSTELVEFVSRVKDRGTFAVALTGQPASPLASSCDLVVRVSSDTADLGGIIAMGSTLATAAWGDALAVVLMSRRGYTWDRVLHSHPGGAVGKGAKELLEVVTGREDRPQ